MQHEGRGLLFAPGDIADAQRQIARLIADPALRTRLCEQALAHAGTLSWPSATRWLTALYREVITARTKRADGLDLRDAGEPRDYFLGVAVWLLGWGAAFAVSALAAATSARHAGRGLLADGARPCGGCRRLWLLAGPAASPQRWKGTAWATRGAAYARWAVHRGVPVPAHAARNPPCRDAADVQAAPPADPAAHPQLRPLSAACGDLRASRLASSFFDDRTALLWTAAVFALTHLGVVLFGLALRVGVILTLASGSRCLLWGGLRLSYGSAWAVC